MPLRPRSHQLEDRSIRDFEHLLPDEWVVRRVTPDYGIDLQIELFEASGESTGLTLLVQMRATDDPRRASYLDVNLEHLIYYDSLNIPAIIVRYDASVRMFRWLWVSSITPDTSSPDQQSVRIHFGDNDIWTADTATQIKRSLEARRKLSSYPADQPIALLATRHCAGDIAYRFDTAVDEVILSAPVLRPTPNTAAPPLEILVDLYGDRLTFRFPGLPSVEDQFDAGGITAGSILYCLCRLLYQFRLSSQCAQIASAILRLQASTRNKDSALVASKALDGDLEKSVSLAILNELHASSDVYCLQYLLFLRVRPHDPSDRSTAFEAFTKAAILRAREAGQNDIAARFYFSLGSYQRERWRYRSAYRALMHAKKLDPAYRNTKHFIIECAACLFNLKRYRFSSRLYALAVDTSSDRRSILYYGDALLMSGRFADAQRWLSSITGDEAGSVELEASVKARLCAWITAGLGRAEATISRRSADAYIALHVNGPAMSKDQAVQVLLHDPLHPWANFVMGLDRVNAGQIAESFWYFLICVISDPEDTRLWENLMASGLHSRDADLLYLALAYTALHKGNGPYQQFRALMKAKGVSDDILQIIDGCQRDVVHLVRDRHNMPTIFRLFNDGGFKSFMPPL